MGVHTGDSVCVAPQQTLPDRLYQQLRDQAIAVIRAIGVETGGSNVQFAVNPRDRGDRRHRDEPAGVALERAGVEGDRLPDRQDRGAAGGRLHAAGDPQRHHAGDARRASSRRSTTAWSSGRGSRSRSSRAPRPELTTHMKSVGEAMAIGRTFQQAFAKALRSRELDSPAGVPRRARGAARARRRSRAPSASTICSRRCVAAPRSRSSTGAPRSTRGSCTSCRSWPPIRRRRSPASAPSSRSTPAPPSSPRRRRTSTPAGSAHRRPTARCRRTRSSAATRPSVVILGSGPNRIGQGIEFDYCCVHAAQTVRESGRDAVMINCNPETVSTDYDTSDRLYFEPLTLEDVLGGLRGRAARGCDRPVRRPDAAEARRRPARRRRPDPRHERPTRSTSPRTAARFGPLLDELGYKAPPYAIGQQRRGGARARARGRLPAAGAPQLRARRPRDGDRLQRRRPAGLPRARRRDRHGRSERATADDLPRPLPRGLDRGRRRRALRRRGRLDRRDHAARRGGRDPLRRLGLRAAAALARRGDARPDPRADDAGSPGRSASSACSTSSSRSTATRGCT